MNVQRSESNEPQVFILNPASLRMVKEKIRVGDQTVRSAWEKLAAEADESLTAGPFSVMQKEVVPPSGDKHDYISMGPYWWPNPETPDGLPYIRRDGETNPERNKTDRPQIGKLCSHVNTLGMAYFFSDDEKYAAHAAELIRTWFLDEETKMNPNLTYGQAIPGICDGRGIGIIDTSGLVNVVEAIGLLRGSSSWTETDQSAVKAWFEQYLDWLLHSENGRDEAKEKNNHGTHYDIQVAVYSLFVGKEEIAEQLITKSAPIRIAEQIEPDGRQPLELVRTKALGYSSMNLKGWFELAGIAERFGIDLWRYQTEDGRGIRAALDFLAPYFMKPEEWPYQQIVPQGGNVGSELLRRAANAYAEPTYERMIPQTTAASRHRMLLRFPALERQ